jgi:hypothetical protein
MIGRSLTLADTRAPTPTEILRLESGLAIRAGWAETAAGAGRRGPAGRKGLVADPQGCDEKGKAP